MGLKSVEPLSLDAAAALTNAGSLLSLDGRIVAPFDLETTGDDAGGYYPLAGAIGIANISSASLCEAYETEEKVHLINGMGVTLGDSVIGLTAVFAVKARFPNLRFVLYRPHSTPRYVQRLYELVAPLLGDLVNLPVRLDSISGDGLRLDLGNHLFWPAFSTQPMIDFFLDAMGLRPETVGVALKCNAWLRRLAVPLRRDIPDEYVLLCPQASTPIRSIPAFMHASLADGLWQRFHLPVLGFGPINHPHYTDVGSPSVDTGQYIRVISGASYLVAPDTAAIHIAAGFGVPTTAFFTTIAPRLRTRDYPRCRSIHLMLPGLDGVHASNRPEDIDARDHAYRRLKGDAQFFDFA